MMQTLEGSGELAEALKLVDEHLLNGLNEASRNALRPILVRPLMQAYAVIVKPAEAELNRVWMAQVFEPYQRTLASKYPFDRQARMEASPVEVAKIFGTEGAVSKFVEQSLGALVLKRGDSITSRTWADMGGASASRVHQWCGQLDGTSGWTVSVCRWRGGRGGSRSSDGLPDVAASRAWLDRIHHRRRWPGVALSQWQGQLGTLCLARAGHAGGENHRGSATTARRSHSSRSRGRFGLEKMINSAQRRRIDDGVFELSWAKAGASVAVQLRIISNADTPAAAAPATSAGGAGAASLGALPAIIAGPVEPVAAEGAL
jgi:type VI secretion system protein ImpL